MPSRFQRAYPPAKPEHGPAFWLLFRGDELLLQDDGTSGAFVQGSSERFANLNPGVPLYLGTLDGVACIACEVQSDSVVPDGWRAVGMRGLYGYLEEPYYGLVGYAAQMLYWQRTSHFCPVCGSPTIAVEGDWGRRCTACGFTRYPQISPAVLALVHDGDRILLTHKPGWGPRFSIVAGFVEPNESLEDCVRREVLEEVGVELDEPTYISSQPWPFPHQLMIGYMASYASGEITIDDVELDDARWFHVDDLPELPGALSLSRQMIDRWIASRRPAR